MTPSPPSPTKKNTTVVVCLDIDSKLWKSFSAYVEKKHGPRKKTKMVERLIEKYVKKHTGKKQKNNCSCVSVPLKPSSPVIIKNGKNPGHSTKRTS